MHTHSHVHPNTVLTNTVYEYTHTQHTQGEDRGLPLTVHDDLVGLSSTNATTFNVCHALIFTTIARLDRDNPVLTGSARGRQRDNEVRIGKQRSVVKILS